MNKDIYISEDDCIITHDDMSIVWDFPETPAMMEGDELHFTWTPSRYLVEKTEYCSDGTN